MVSRLRQDHDLRVLSAVAASLMHLLLIVPRALANDNAPRVASVSEVHRVAVLVDSDDSAATKAGIKASLSLELRLDLKKAGHKSFPDSLVFRFQGFRLRRHLLRAVAAQVLLVTRFARLEV